MCPVPLRCDISFLFALALLSVRMAGPFAYEETEVGGIGSIGYKL